MFQAQITTLAITFETWAPIIVGIVAALSGAATTLFLIRSQNRAAKRKALQRILEECYGPLEQAILRSNMLHQRFAKRLTAENPSFKAIPFLLNNGHAQLKADEKELLKQIVIANAAIEKIVMEKAGLIDDQELATTLLPDLLHHLLIFKLVETGTLKGEIDELKHDVFPKAVIPAIRRKKKDLEAELKK